MPSCRPCLASLLLQLLQLLLLLLPLLLGGGDAAYRIGIVGQMSSLSRLSNMNSTQLREEFGREDISFVNVSFVDDDSRKAVLAYKSSVQSLGLNAVVGSYEKTLASVCTQLQLPLYTVTPIVDAPSLAESGYLSTSTTLIVHSLIEKLLRVSLNFTQTVARRNAMIIITDNPVMLLDTLLDFAPGVQLQMVRLDSSSNDSWIRESLHSSIGKIAVTECVVSVFIESHSLVDRVLHEALHLSMLKSNAFWLIAYPFLPDELILPYRRSGATVLLFRLSHAEIGDNDQLVSVMVDDSIRHFLASDTNNATNATSIMEKIFLTKSRGQLYSLSFDRTTRQRRQIYFALMTTDRDNPTSLVQYAVWNNTNNAGFQVTASTPIVVLPRLKFVGTLMEPFLMRSQSGVLVGFCASALQYIATDLFTYEIVLTNDSFVDAVRNGSADAAVNLVSQRADLVTSRAVRFSQLPLLYSGISALGHTVLEEVDFLSPLYPLTWNVWFAILLAFVVLSATLYLTDKISPNDYKRPKFSITSAAFFVYSSFVMSKLKSSAVKPSSRIFILILWFASLMYCTSYGTNYFFLLINKDRGLGFSNLSDLYNQRGAYYWMLEAGSQEAALLSNQSVGSVYRKLADEAVSSKRLVGSLQEGMEIVLNSTLAGQSKPVFIGDDATIEYFAKRECRLQYTETTEFSSGLFMIFSSSVDADLIQRINAKLQTMNDKGRLEEIKAQYWTTVQCSANENLINYDELEAVTIDKLAGIFIVLAAAFVLSFLVVSMEHVAHLATLQIQRLRANTKLEFGKSCRATVTAISSIGVHVKLHGHKEFIPNEMLSPDKKNTYTASDLQITNGSEIEVIYLGNDPATGARIFHRRAG